MLDVQAIRQISADRKIPEIVIEKDYILNWILWGLTQFSELKNNLVFKGGTALHKMYFAGWRFSEDLDFTTINQINEVNLEKSITELCKTVKNKSSILLNLKKINKAGDQQGEMWSIELILEYVGPRAQDSGDLPVVRIHVTNDELLLKRPQIKTALQPPADMKEDISLLTYSIEEIVAEKLRTVMHQRCYPRDVYDCWRLFKEYGHVLDIVDILSIYRRKCLWKDLKPGIPDNFDERILRLKNQWEQGLSRQVTDIPSFELAFNEFKTFVKDLFGEKYKIEGGDLKMLEAHYSIRYKKADLEIEVHGDKDFVESKFNELIKLELPSKKQEIKMEKESVVQLGKEKRKISLAEFQRTKNIKGHEDRILVYGHYLEEYAGFESFNTADIENCYFQVRQPKTKNFGVFIRNLISKGYLEDAPEKKDNKKAWRLTSIGIEHVKSLRMESATQ